MTKLMRGCGHQLSDVQSQSSSRVKNPKKAYTVENTKMLAPPIKAAAPYSIYRDTRTYK